MNKRKDKFIEIENTQVYNNTGKRIVGINKLIYLFKKHLPTVAIILILAIIIGILDIYKKPSLIKMSGGAGVVGAKTVGQVTNKLTNFTSLLKPFKPIMDKLSIYIVYICIFMLIPAFPILVILLVMFHFSGRFFYKLRKI